MSCADLGDELDLWNALGYELRDSISRLRTSSGSMAPTPRGVVMNTLWHSLHGYRNGGVHLCIESDVCQYFLSGSPFNSKMTSS